jgi:SAM-dependent methyltransferase
MYINAEDDNMNNIIALYEKFMPKPDRFLDTWCWDGLNTKRYGVPAKSIHWTDVILSPSLEMENLQFLEWNSNTDRVWYEDNSFDLIISNQVIEHLTEIDNYFTEISRILKKWGIFIVSSNNLSSWHNIFALMLWWIPFDLQNFSITSASTGNPLWIHNGEWVHFAMRHKTIYVPRAIKELWERYGMVYLENKWAWYYPFNYLAKFDARHSAFFAIAFQK